MELQYIKDAYRKLKGSLYYDKTLAYIRTRIVRFEDGQTERELKRVADSLKSEEKWSNLEKEIVNSIEILTLPKSIQEASVKNDTNVISNIQSGRTEVMKYNNFIDMDILGFLVGILWITKIGAILDAGLDSSCYGNRLRRNLVLGTNEITSSPNLFMPYFEQYESWRNRGIYFAEKAVCEKDKNIVITMLDLSKFYYSIDLPEEKYWGFVKDICKKDEEAYRIAHCTWQIIENYSAKLKYGNIVLPIGFLPSNILANYYLREIDNRFINADNKIYYGRYVDDIMFVQEIPAELSADVTEKGTTVISEWVYKQLCERSILEKTDENDNDADYKLFHEERLILQKKKFRFFYLDKSGSKAVIERIKKDIAKNTSEFNFIPEEYGNNLSTDLYDVTREDTVNKVRGIKSAELDKYVLSKTVGKNVLMSAFSKDEDVEEFCRSLDCVLGNKEILSNYLLWESVLNYYVVNNRIDEIKGFTTKIIEALALCDTEAGKKINDKGERSEFDYLNSSQAKSVADSMLQFFYANMTRALSVVWGAEVQHEISEICTYVQQYSNGKFKNEFFKLVSLRNDCRLYITSRMMNKGVLPVEIETILRIWKTVDAKTGIRNFTNLKMILAESKRMTDRCEESPYIPYVRNPYEILFSHLVYRIITGYERIETSNETIQYLQTEYDKNFGKQCKDHVLKCCVDFENVKGFDKLSFWTNPLDHKLRIAVANVHMKLQDVQKILSEEKLDITERCRDITAVVNEAIKVNANVVVLPETYVPIEYLTLLAKKAASHQMLIICGVSHILHSKKVYNLTCTLVPIVLNGNVKYVVPIFHQKSYFAPDELKALSENNLTPAGSSESALMSWNGINFATYCCYEMTSIEERSRYSKLLDILFAVEWNRDVNYFSNIIESLSRDMYCYCVQANMSEYGDSRITRPAHSFKKDVVKIKGGENATIIVGTVDIDELRECRKDENKRNDLKFAELPAGW